MIVRGGISGKRRDAVNVRNQNRTERKSVKKEDCVRKGYYSRRMREVTHSKEREERTLKRSEEVIKGK